MPLPHTGDKDHARAVGASIVGGGARPFSERVDLFFPETEPDSDEAGEFVSDTASLPSERDTSGSTTEDVYTDGPTGSDTEDLA